MSVTPRAIFDGPPQASTASSTVSYSFPRVPVKIVTPSCGRENFRIVLPLSIILLMHNFFADTRTRNLRALKAAIGYYTMGCNAVNKGTGLSTHHQRSAVGAIKIALVLAPAKGPQFFELSPQVGQQLCWTAQTRPLVPQLPIVKHQMLNCLFWASAHLHARECLRRTGSARARTHMDTCTYPHTDARAHARTCARPHTHTAHACSHTNTRTRTRTHKYTRTHNTGFTYPASNTRFSKYLPHFRALSYDCLIRMFVLRSSTTSSVSSPCKCTYGAGKLVHMLGAPGMHESERANSTVCLIICPNVSRASSRSRR